MGKFKSNTLTKFCTCVLFLTLVSIIVVPEHIKAQEKRQNWIEVVWRRLTTRPKRKQRPATVSKGGGNRDLCPDTSEKLIAIVPFAEKTEVPYVEQTISAHPTFRFYIPYTPTLGLKAEFLLKDVEENLVYKNKFALKATPGIVNLTLPKREYDLKVGEQYRWVFSIICNPANRSADNTVNGWIKRTSTSEVLPKNPATASEKERLRLYADSFLWFDMIDTLLSLKRTYPKEAEFKTTWEVLLRKIGLSDEAISRDANP